MHVVFVVTINDELEGVFEDPIDAVQFAADQMNVFVERFDGSFLDGYSYDGPADKSRVIPIVYTLSSKGG